MLLSVVVPTLNEASRVARAVDSALGLARGWGGGVEVVVSDGGSADATREHALAAGARVVTGSPGRGTQLRRGVEATTGAVVLLLHADATLDPEGGAHLARALADPRVAWGAFRQRIDDAGLAYRLIERGNAFRARRLALPYGDQAVFARRAALDAVGGVPALPLMEDVDLARRLRRAAGRPALLEGPVTVSARRWRRYGVALQTARNGALLSAYLLGASPERLARWYHPHGHSDNGETRPS